MENLSDELKRYNAGATIINSGTPFSSLISLSNKNDLSAEFIKKWVQPYYNRISLIDNNFRNELIHLKSNLNEEIISLLLGDFNWRSRLTGAFFSSITDSKNFIDIIGVHLLKSELALAGEMYSISLGYFNCPKSVKYLDEYLSYYLLRKDLYFDQKTVIETLCFLDNQNKTNLLSKHLKNWKEFISDKEDIDYNINYSRIKTKILMIKSISNNIDGVNDPVE